MGLDYIVCVLWSVEGCASAETTRLRCGDGRYEQKHCHTHTHTGELKRVVIVSPLSLRPGVCSVADGTESPGVGLESGHSHGAHRPVQHSKVGGARASECSKESVSIVS